MTRHLATLRCYRPHHQLLPTDHEAPVLVPPNGITHEPAVNRGLDCTLSRPFPGRPTPYQSLKGGGGGQGRHLIHPAIPPSPADRARAWVDYHCGRSLTGVSARLSGRSPCGWYQAFWQLFPATGSSRNHQLFGSELVDTRRNTLFRPPIPSYLLRES